MLARCGRRYRPTHARLLPLRAAREPGSYVPADAAEDVEARVTGFGALAQPDIAARFVEAAYASHLERVRADLDRHPSRVLANALVDTARRSGPVEDIHAGDFRGCPLDQRRVTLCEECELMAFASGRLALGMTVCLQFSMERPPRPWPEQVLPYGLA